MRPNMNQALATVMVAATLLAPAAAVADPSTTASSPTAAPGTASGTAPGDAGLTNVKVSRDRAIAIAKATFTIPDDLGEPNVSSNQTQDGATWMLYWQSPAKSANRININVTIDAMTGSVRNYNRGQSMPDDSAPLSYTRDEALKLANQWLAKLAPDLQDSLRLQDNPLNFGYYYGGAGASYAFHWERIAQGYPVQNDGVNISLDARTGELQSFYASWRPDAAFTPPSVVLDQAKAEATYRAQVQMMLGYQQFQKPGTDQAVWKLTYRPATGWYPFVTQDGKLLAPTGANYDPTTYQQLTKVPTPDQPYQAPNAPLTQAQALQIAKAAAGRTDDPTSSNYNESSQPQAPGASGQPQKTRSWSFNWMQKGELQPGQYNTSVQIDADLGEITSFNNWGAYNPLKDGEQPKLSDADAQAKAIAFIRANRPDLAGNSILMPPSDQIWMQQKLGKRPPTQRFSFALLKNGIPVYNRQFSVEIDARTGNVSNFWGGNMDLQQEKLPDATGVISPAAALDAFLKVQGLQATWVTFYQPGAPGDKPPQPQLVWMPKTQLPVAAFDALTGTPLDNQGRDLIEAMKHPTDIQGHFAQREIELLWERGTFDLQDGKFNPDQPATAADLTRWLVLVKGMQPYMGYNFRGAMGKGASMAFEAATAAPYFGAAFQSGILRPEDFAADAAPDAPVSREMFALWAVRAMGYEKIATMPDPIALTFADKNAIGAKYANAVAILHGLGILKGDGTAFLPQQSITRGAAARILFAVATETRR